jgi:hypothetical protein
VSDETSFDKIAASLDHAEDTGRQQVVLSAQDRFKGDYWDLPDQSLIANKADQIAFNDRFKEVQAHNAQVKAEESNYISAGQKAVSDRIAARREQAGREFTESQTNKREVFTQGEQDKRMDYDTKAKALAVKTAEEHAARAPRDTGKTFALEPDANGKFTGKQPADYFKDQAGLAEDGKIDPDLRETQYAKEFSNRNDRINMDSALVNGFRYTHDSTAPELADALRGYVIGGYHADWQAVPPDGYGQRVSIVFTRPSDSSMVSVILPIRDWANVKGMADQRAALTRRNTADKEAVANNPYRAPAPDNAGQSAGTPISRALGWQRGGAIPPRPMQRYG